jgi:RNA polymerase sigma-70 factor (ECF subfamily)
VRAQDRSPHAEFTGRAQPFRRELLAHCYRMLGSLDDAEDLVQETYLRAWRSYGEFEERSSMRTWLYRIATNACLTALTRRGRRVLPSGLDAASENPYAAPSAADGDVDWLGPLPPPATACGSRSSARCSTCPAGSARCCCCARC